MPILVDSNVILDVVSDDPEWGDWSDDQISRNLAKGIVINPVIYAELSVGATTHSEVDALLKQLSLGYLEIPREALFLAGQAFLKYRRSGGLKTSPLPDFFIGAHAEASGLSLLTRDARRYRNYFPTVGLISP